MKRGVPPTAVNARTGEFTPPGMRAHASAKSFAETSVLDMPPVFQQGPMRQLQGVVASPVRCEFSPEPMSCRPNRAAPTGLVEQPALQPAQLLWRHSG